MNVLFFRAVCSWLNWSEMFFKCCPELVNAKYCGRECVSCSAIFWFIQRPRAFFYSFVQIKPFYVMPLRSAKKTKIIIMNPIFGEKMCFNSANNTPASTLLIQTMGYLINWLLFFYYFVYSLWKCKKLIPFYIIDVNELQVKHPTANV